MNYAYCHAIVYIKDAALYVDLRRNTDHIFSDLVLVCPVHSETWSTTTHQVRT